MNDPKQQYVPLRKATFLTGLEAQTIRKMADKGVIQCYKTPSGQRRFNIQSLQKLCTPVVHNQEKPDVPKENYIYVRVSTKKQVDDLSRQLEYVKRPEYSNYTVIQDIASGINFKRKGLSTILEACLQGRIGEIVVAHRDRLCRFGFELVEELVTKSGGRITVLDCQNDKSSEQELTDDLLAIIHVFSCKQMGRRSYTNRKAKSKDPGGEDLSDSKPEDSD